MGYLVVVGLRSPDGATYSWWRYTGQTGGPWPWQGYIVLMGYLVLMGIRSPGGLLSPGGAT